QTLRLPAEFGRLTGDVDFEQYRQLARLFARDPGQFLRKGKAVHTFDGFKQADCVTALVGLEMADQVPPKPARTQRDFGTGFLDAVLAEKREPERGRLPHAIRRLIFADGE